MIGIQPSEFWQMSLSEIYSAIKGFREFNTVDSQEPLSKTELDNLMELYPD